MVGLLIDLKEAVVVESAAEISNRNMDLKRSYVPQTVLWLPQLERSANYLR